MLSSYIKLYKNYIKITMILFIYDNVYMYVICHIWICNSSYTYKKIYDNCNGKKNMFVYSNEILF